MEPFDWQRLFVGEEDSWLFLLEVVFRTVCMYGILIAFFKFTGKTGIKQLSVFDLILIIGLGSAAGDPMFYEDVPLIHALVVFVTILLLYLGINKLTQKSHKLDVYLEGDSEQVLHRGVLEIKQLCTDGLTTHQFFSELRQRGISHLGQLKAVYLEFSGEISVFYFEDEEVTPGLPLFPECLRSAKPYAEESGAYSCSQCGLTQVYENAGPAKMCPKCGETKILKSAKEKRIT